MATSSSAIDLKEIKVTKPHRVIKVSLVSNVGEVLSVRWRVPERKGADTYAKALSKDPCVYCGKTKPRKLMSKEHIVPRSERGRDGWMNIAAACKECNGRRSSLPLLQFLMSQGGIK